MPVCLVLDGKEIKGESTNISEGGIALLLQHALPKNAAPRLQFTLPASGPALDVDTQVAWADLKGYVGLRFVNLPASSQELLEGWLTTQMERQTSGPTDILAAPTPRAIQ
jgi:c-di-GMP-binding flagellar brake protein YcgR